MSVNSISSYLNSTAANTSSSSTSTSSSGSTSELGKDEFLNLLVTQLRYQDPLNPTDNSEYVSQLAEFSALEQMTNMTNGISSMEALTMTGKMVVASVTDSTTGKTSEIQGVVDSVKLKSGVATLLVNGEEVDLEDVTAVYDYDRSDVSTLSNLIGQTCKGYIYDSETLAVMDIEGTVTSIEKGTYEDYASVDGVEGTLYKILSNDYDDSDSEIDYLNDHVGEEIDISITDTETGKVVPVTAKLISASEEDNEITVTLNGVKMPVDGIYSINKDE